MSNLSLSYVDIGIIIIYLVLCLAIGLKKYGKIKTIRDYALGTKPFATTVLFCTTFATAISSSKTIGFVGKAYEIGMTFIVPILCAPFGWFIMAKIFLPNLEFLRQKKFMSLSDIMEYWYGKEARWATNICALLITIGVTAVSISAIGYLLHYFLHIPKSLGMLIGVLTVTIYSAIGGIQAVALTDVFQFLIFFLAIPIACAIGIDKVGGVSDVFKALPATHLAIDSKNIVLFLSILFCYLIPAADIPYIQRTLIAKDAKQFKRTFVTTGILMWPFTIIILFIGLITYKLNPNIEPSTALYYFVDNTLPSVAKGLMVAGLLAVIMSSQDSFLNAAGVLIARDVCKQLWPKLSNKDELIIARVSCVLISILAISVVMIKQDILSIVWFIGNFYDPIITMPLLAALLGARMSGRSFVVLVVLVLISETITKYITGSFDTISIMSGLITSMIVILIANHRYRKQNPELFPLKSSKSVFSILKETAQISNFSLSSLYIISFIIALNFSAALFFLDLTKYTLINYACSIGILLCLLLLLNELWNNPLRRLLPHMWNFTAFFCLICVPSYVLFASHYFPLWILNFILSAVLFYLLTNPVVFFGLVSLGLMASYISSITVKHLNADLDSSTFAICSCAFTVIAIMGHIYKEKYIDKEVLVVLEEKVSERTIKLKEALAIKEEFLNKLSHEIRTPLQGIIGISTELDREWDRYSSENKKKYVHMIASSGDRLMSYTKNILDFALYNKNVIKLNLEQDVDLVEIATDVIQDSESLIISLNKRQKITLELDKLKSINIECDRTKITEVFYNLVNNAIKYSKEGKIIVKIDVDKEKDHVKISVIDQGVGVPENERYDIFNPFTESSRTKTRAGGTGLGLSIVREIVYLHKGVVNVENNYPQGSKFIFTLPIKQNKDSRSAETEIKVSRGRILIVDDEYTCLNSLTMILLELGYEPYTAQSGAQALEYLKKNYQNIDVVLLDLVMPDINGIEVLKQMKSDPNLKKIPVIMESGYTSANNDEIKLAESKLGASQKSIAKPYNREDIEAALVLVLHNKENRKSSEDSSAKLELV